MSYVIVAHRSGASICGPLTAYAKDRNGTVKVYETEELARAQAKIWNDRLASPNVHYTVEEYQS